MAAGDARHFFVLTYIFFIACYIFLTALVAPIINTGTQNQIVMNVNSSNFTWNASSGSYTNSPDIYVLVNEMIAFHTSLWMLDALLIGPGALYLVWIVVTAVVRGT